MGGVPIAPAARISTLHSMFSIAPSEALVLGSTRFPFTSHRYGLALDWRMELTWVSGRTRTPAWRADAR